LLLLFLFFCEAVVVFFTWEEDHASLSV
jgi:hypothetical protein